MTDVQCKILVVGCGASLCVDLSLWFGEGGFSVICQGFDDLTSTLPDYQPDVVIIAPVDGECSRSVELVRSLSSAPVVLLLPLGSGHDVRAEAFRSGADEVVAESHGLDELTLRIDAILEREARRDRLVVGDLVVDVRGHAVTRGGQALDLTELEFGVLTALVRRAGAVVSKRELLAEVWGFDQFDVNIVEVHVSALRRKLEAVGPRVIETVRARGYVVRESRRTVGSPAREDDPARLPFTYESA